VILLEPISCNLHSDLQGWLDGESGSATGVFDTLAFCARFWKKLFQTYSDVSRCKIMSRTTFIYFNSLYFSANMQIKPI